jgi:hypothetical protein
VKGQIKTAEVSQLIPYESTIAVINKGFKNFSPNFYFYRKS